MKACATTLLILCAAKASVASAAASAASATSIDSTTTRVCISGSGGGAVVIVDGKYIPMKEADRCYYVHGPSRYDRSASLVIDLHGWASSAEQIMRYSGWKTIAENHGNLVVVWPEGTMDDGKAAARVPGGGRGWNAGGHACRNAQCKAVRDNVDDVSFIREVVASVKSTHIINPRHIFASGHSNGCSMAHRLGLEASDMIAAVGCFAGYPQVPAPPTYSPISFMDIHGTADTNVPIQEAFDVYNLELKTANACTSHCVRGKNSELGFLTDVCLGCAKGTRLVGIGLPGVSHEEFHYDPKSGKINGVGPYMFLRDGRFTTALVWDFFQQEVGIAPGSSVGVGGLIVALLFASLLVGVTLVLVFDVRGSRRFLARLLGPAATTAGGYSRNPSGRRSNNKNLLRKSLLSDDDSLVAPPHSPTTEHHDGEGVMP